MSRQRQRPDPEWSTSCFVRHLPPDYEKKTFDEIERIRKVLEQLQQTSQNAYYRAWPPADAPTE